MRIDVALGLLLAAAIAGLIDHPHTTLQTATLATAVWALVATLIAT
jgi:hypothetical protein